MIYFFQTRSAEAFIKIGHSTVPGSRLLALQTSSPHPLEALGIMEGGLEEEAKLHARFSEHRARGEWFNPHPSILSFVKKNADPLPERRKRGRPKTSKQPVVDRRLSLPADLHARIATRAAENRRSVAAETLVLIEKGLK